MITLLHGDHIEASRRALVAIKENAAGKEIRELDGRTLDVTLLTSALESRSLFDRSICIVIERLLFHGGKKPKRTDDLIQQLAKHAKEADIVLWEEGKVSDATIRALGPDISAQLFAVPDVLFRFLDSLRPDNAQALLALYESLRRKESAELVFSMMVKRIRQLIQIGSGTAPCGLKDWQIARLTTQAKSFSMKKLGWLHQTLRFIDYAVKTGASPFSLSEHIELLLVALSYGDRHFYF